ncbi:protein kinase domain-containing protein [Pseudoalteromonas sp. SS15]|uniref:protein kinase domain-containing protein n=1 Tax=Pseudoalteromonas sp. SS15 TaxID=3139393 RepID=UPI003BA9F947
MSLYQHFEALLDLDSQAQNDYLTALQDAELLSQLQALLTHHNQLEEATDWHDLVAEQVGRVTGDEQLHQLQGTHIGPYQLTEMIGQGGMGVVYKAERVDGALKQSVAIKFLMPSVIRVVGEQNAKNEAQILATLNHPNITKVFDAGTTDGGIHYFVMELLDGLPIDVYCEHHTLTFDDTIKLVLDVADAIQSAHLLNIAHTDIKPSNIFVTSSGLVKVLDFGIAKLVHGQSEGNHQQALKQYLQAMSLPYASPEQLANDTLTLKTDQYSLAVLLYKLLSKQLPFETDGKTKPEIIKTKQTLPSIPLSKQVSGFKNKRLIGSDLEFILGKALQIEPKNRFDSVKTFKSELHRYLRHLPLHNRKHSVVYKLKKWLQRSPAQAAIYAVLAVSSMTFYQQNIRIEAERKTAEQVAEQMINIFKMTDPTQGFSPTLSAKDILLQGAQNIEQDENINFVAKSRLMTSISESLIGLGYYSESIPFLKNWSNNHEFKATNPSLYFKSNRLYAKALRGVGDTQASYALTKQLLANIDEYKPSQTEQLDAYINLASLGMVKVSQAGYDEVQSLLEKTPSIEDPDRYWQMKVSEFTALQDDAYSLYFHGHINKEEMQAKHQQVKEMAKALDNNLPKTHFDYAHYQASKAWLEIEYGTQCKDCVQNIINAMPKLEKKYGKDHRHVDFAYRQLAQTYELERKFDKQIEVLEHVVNLRERRYGQSSYEFLEQYLSMSRAYETIGKVELSENMRLYAYNLFKTLDNNFNRTEINIGLYGELHTAIAMFEATEQMDKAYPYILEAEKLLHSDPIFKIDSNFDIQSMLMTSRKNYILEGVKFNIAFLRSQQSEFSFPNDFELNFELARMYFFDQQFELSIDHYEQAMAAIEQYRKTIPSFFAQHIGLQYMKSLAAAGRLEQAQKEFDTCYTFNYLANPSEDNFWLGLLEKIAKQYNLKVNVPELSEYQETLSAESSQETKASSL